MSPVRELMSALILVGGFVAPAQALAQATAGAGDEPVADPRRSIWRFELSADGTWFENAYFLGLQSSDAEWSTNGRATLAYAGSFRSGKYSLSGYGGAIYYPEIDDYNQPTYGGTFALEWKTSRRSTLMLGQDYNHSNTRFLEMVDAEGLPLPTSPSDYATSTLTYEAWLSRRWQVVLDGGFLMRRYQDPLLVDGDQLVASLQVGPHVGRNGWVFFSYGYTSAWLDTQRFRAHEALVGGRRKVDRGLGFEVAGGVGYVEQTEEFYPAGRASVTATGRKARLELLYKRDFGQAYGYGRQMIGDTGSATFFWTPTRSLTLDASYNAGYRRDPADESFTVRSGIARAGFSWDVGGGVDFAVHYAWERNETVGLPVAEGGRVTGALTYGVDWR